MLAGYALTSGVTFGVFMNLWFWPFLGVSAPTGMGFVPGASVTENLGHYAVFYLATSLAWDLPRGVLNAILVTVAGPALLRVFRPAARRAAFGSESDVDPSPGNGALPASSHDVVAPPRPWHAGQMTPRAPTPTLVTGPVRSG